MAPTDAGTGQPRPAVEPSKERVVRVFISSTFKDMQEERDILVKRTFPELRQRCRERGVELFEVDLRWGVTEQQAERGEVLPVCLAMIEHCRPFFIGLLGERYGWVPEPVDQELADAYPTVQGHCESSVTELEILHGVLNEPEMARRAFFYFRDPEYVERVSADRRADFLPESHEAHARLEALKTRIRAAGLPVVDAYGDPETVGLRILEDLWVAIDREFPAGSEPGPLDREASEHEAVAKSRTRVYVGRQEYLDRLDRHVVSTDPPLIVLGESGCGKSALLAKWAERCKLSHPEAFFLLHFIGSTPRSADSAAMLQRIMGELKRRFGFREEVPTRPEELRTGFARWLHMAAAQGPVVLVLDALNQLEDREGARDLVWLPEHLPAHVRVILSTLPGPSLEALQKRGWPTLTVTELTVSERRTLIHDYLWIKYRKRLGDVHVEALASAQPSSTPLYLQVLLEELRVFGVHERLDQRIAHYLEARTVGDLYTKVLARLEEDYDEERHGLVRDTMSLLWAARRGLSEAELLEILGAAGGPLPRAVWAPLYLASKESLVSHSGLLTFSHDYLRQAVQRRYLDDPTLQRSAHLRIAEHFAHRELGERKIEELPWQLAEAHDWQRLAGVLTDLPFLAEAARFDLLALKGYWARIEDGSQLRLVDAYRVVWESAGQYAAYAWDVGSLLEGGGHTRQAGLLHASLGDHFNNTGDDANRGRALMNLSNNLRLQGKLEDALMRLGEAEILARRQGDRAGVAFCVFQQALILFDQRELDGCITRARAFELYCRQERDWNGLVQGLGCLATALQFRGEFTPAATLLDEMERVCRQEQDVVGLADCLHIRSEILRRLGRMDDALGLLAKNQQLNAAVGDVRRLAQCLGQQAAILQSIGRAKEAFALLEEQERLSQQIGSQIGVAKALGNQAVILLAWHKLDEALARAKQQEAISQKVGDLGELQLSLNNQALILQAKRDPGGALQLLERKEQISRQIRDPKALASCLNNQATILISIGRLKEAKARLEEKATICRRLNDTAGLASCLGNQALILGEEDDREGALALHREAYSLFRQMGDPQGMAIALLQEGLLLADGLGDPREARRVLQEALQLAQQHGLAGLAKQIRTIVERQM